MIQRYQSEKLKDLWSDQNRYESFLKVELAAAKAWQIIGLYDEGVYNKIAKATFKLEDIYELEKITRHDVIAFTRTLSNSLEEEKKWIHYGLTSTDVVDSAQAIILKEVNEIIKDKINQLLYTLKEKAFLYKDTPIIGRTHGIHAEVTSFGLKFALWYQDLVRINEIFLKACENVEVIKVSGAVGNYAANTPELEELISKLLEIPYATISTQVLQRDRHANYISAVTLIGSELEKISTEIRHLSRSEVNEVKEGFSVGQKGSSAMPHKKNPIGSENISGLSRVLRGYLVSSFENINLWHERDISHSSVERIILADATTLVEYMLNRMNIIINNLVIDDKKMLENINLTKGVVFSQHVLSKIIDKTGSRENAYDLVQKLAILTLETNKDFIEVLRNNEEIKQILSNEEINNIFNIKNLLVHVSYIYERVFND